VLDVRLEGVAVADVMHPGLIAVTPDTSLGELAAVLADRRVHAVAIARTPPGTDPADGGWAFASDMDLVRAVAAGRLDARAGRIAGTEIVVVDPADRLDMLARRLVEHGVRHAVVADGAGTPLGVVSSLDVLRVLAIRAWL
jgi:CBS domain-containing protein